MRDKWSDLYANYFNLKELLTEKYGEPAEVIEKFDTSYEPRDDSSKMYAISWERCKYLTTYETENGIIELSIDNDGQSYSGFVKLMYIDNINSDIIRETAKRDL